MTAPTVTVLPKPETVLDVDLSAEVECLGIGEGACHNAATWAAVFSECRHGTVKCDSCHDVLVRELADGWRFEHIPCEGIAQQVIEWRRL